MKLSNMVKGNAVPLLNKFNSRLLKPGRKLLIHAGPALFLTGSKAANGLMQVIKLLS